ncbi:MAG: transglutaminase domain-containing protein [Butyricicoccus sp.]
MKQWIKRLVLLATVLILGSSIKLYTTQQTAAREPEETEAQHTVSRAADSYFYRQLDETEQMLYDGLYENRKDMKNGTSTISFGEQFSDVLDLPRGTTQLNQSFQAAVDAYLQDNPNLFYLDVSHLYLHVDTTTFLGLDTYDVYINNSQTESYLAKPFTSEQKVKRAEQRLKAVRKQVVQQATGDDYTDICMVHDYLVDNVEYDSSHPDTCYSAYGALVKNRAVCQGYAKAFQYLMDALDIPCILVSGTASDSDGNLENHAWNYVQLSGAWYAVDVTWDDPVFADALSETLLSASSRTAYLLKGERTMSEDHFPDGELTDGSKVFSYPKLNKQDYK